MSSRGDAPDRRRARAQSQHREALPTRRCCGGGAAASVSAHLADEERADVMHLFDTTAEGNAVVVQLLLVRFETAPRTSCTTDWGQVFGDDCGRTLAINGESFRLKTKKRAGLLGREP